MAGLERHRNANFRELKDERIEEAQDFFNNIEIPEQDNAILEFETSGGAKLGVVDYAVPDGMQVKRVFRYLSHFCDLMPGDFGGYLRKPDKQNPGEFHAPIEYKYGLMLTMRIGGEQFRFVISPSGKPETRQMVIQFVDKTYAGSHSYDGIIGQLTGDSEPDIANTILLALEGTTGENADFDWGEMTQTQREAAKELMVLTHVAESAVPAREELEKLNANDPKDWMHVSGRLAVSSKQARFHLRAIGDGNETFNEVFNSVNGTFLLARLGGVRLGKNALYRDGANNRDLTEYFINEELSQSSRERNDSDALSEQSLEEEV